MKKQIHTPEGTPEDKKKSDEEIYGRNYIN
jgi:hypothetical protein